MSPPLADFLHSVPSPLTFALVHLAPAISALRCLVQISTWSTPSWHQSWLALASWWAVCLLLDRWFLPFVVCGLFAVAQWYQKPKPPTTEITLQNIVADLTIIQSFSWPLPSITLPKLFRVAALLYLPYAVLAFFLSFRVVCAIIGTLFLTWRAPWAIILRATVWRSAWFRWAVYKAWAFLTGEPLPSPSMSPQPSITSAEPVQSLRFLFTVYENQRWWVGLDWTAALLPGERPSWCSAAQHPISPPNAFALPGITSVYLPDGKGGRLKRTATWKWEEPEWRVMLHKEGSSATRVERPVPTVKEETPNSSRLLKAAGRLREGSLGSSSDSNKPATGNLDDHNPEDLKENSDDEPLTDADGWVYADNKWEGQSNKGGMGKYTRSRRWTRVAIVFEVVETVSAGDIGIQREEPAPPLPSTERALEDEDHHSEVVTIIGNPPDTPLRQRLRNALHKPQ